MFSKSLLLHLLVPASISAATVCGVVGIHNSDALNLYMGNFFYNGPSNFALCAAWCKNDANQCRSFRYSYYGDANSQYCEFFDGALDGLVTPDNTQPYFYYDVACGFRDFVTAVTVTTAMTVAATGGGGGGGIQTITTTATSITTQQAAPVTQTVSTTATVARQTVTVQKRVTAYVTRSATQTLFRTITRRA